MLFQDISEVGEITSFLSAQALLIVLAIVFVIVAIFSAVLFYHWRKYGAGSARILMMEIIYLIGVVSLLTAAAAAATSF